MIPNFDRKMTCAFTGRRPTSFAWGYDENHEGCIKLKEVMMRAILGAYDNGYRNFLVGGAQGADMMALELVLTAREVHPDIMLYAIIPALTQPDRWPRKTQERYHAGLSRCDSVIVIAKSCNTQTYHLRNCALVDSSSHMIAIWEGDRRGGTWHTIAYAQKMGVTVETLWV